MKKVKKKPSKDDIRFEFSNVVIAFRLKHGLTIEKLAKVLGVGAQTIKKLELNP